MYNSERSFIFESLGQLRYFSTLQFVDAVVGNSSSGIIEVPSFNIPTLNIGNRQNGRIAAKSVINCSTNSIDIEDNLVNIFKMTTKNKKIINPYKKLNTANKIVKEIKIYLNEKNSNNCIKIFNDLI